MEKVLIVKSTAQDTLLSLIRLGIGLPVSGLNSDMDWNGIDALAAQHGLIALVLDGVEQLPEEQKPPKDLLLQWIGEVIQMEAEYAAQQKAAAKMAQLFHKNYIRTYVLKGTVVSECYPKPNHRLSSDMDCYLLPEEGDFDAWALGNELIKSKDYDVRTGFYKNSTFYLPDLMVENHQYMVPFRGNKTLKKLELMLRSYMNDDKGKDRFDDTCLCRPPIMVSALFLIEHAYSHFLHEGLTWRHVLDWVMFSRKHKEDVNWYVLDALIDEFGFRRFYDAYKRLGQYLTGELTPGSLTKPEKKMLADVWAPLDLHETLHGVKGKLCLVGNTLRAWWKYHYFAEISMPHALWIWAYGGLFDKNPKLN